MFRKKRKDPFKEIQACLQKRDYKGALDWFHTLLQKDPKNSQIRLRFADTLVLAGSKKEAVKQLRQVADQLAEKGFVIRAIAINKKILQIDPRQTDVHEKLAEMQGQRGSFGEPKQRLADVLRSPGQSLRAQAEPDEAEDVAVAETEAEAEPPPQELPLMPPPPKDAPLRRAEAAPEPELVAAEPQALPELSLEESMAMEFGDSTSVSSGEPDLPAVTAEPEIVEISDASDVPHEGDESVGIIEPVVEADGGFEALAEAPEAPLEAEELALAEDPVFTEEPLFAEAPLDLSDDQEEQLADTSSSSAEIVLEVDVSDTPEIFADEPVEAMVEVEAEPIVLPAEAAGVVEDELVMVDPASVEVIELPGETQLRGAPPELVDDDPVVISDESTLEVPEEDVGFLVPGEEMEVVEFQIDEDESEMVEQESAELLDALGEDIDSLIDSIISDVASPSIVVPDHDEEPPTRIPLFSDLTTAEFIDVALLLVRRVFKAGEVAVREGDPGDSMFVISTGEVRATVERDGQQLPVATLRDGDFFGEMAVLTGEPRTATVTAVKTTEVLELNRENLKIICSRHPHVEAKIRLSYDERVSNGPG